MYMKCLSVRQPWAWLIINGYKDIENRDWPTSYRGRILIHASKTQDAPADRTAQAIIKKLGLDLSHMPANANLTRGGIIGAVDIVECVTASDSPWFTGDYGWKLANPELLPFRPFKGRQGFFGVDYEALYGR